LPNDPKVFYNDLPEDEQKHWFSLIQPHSVGTMHAGCTAASWKEIPTFYLVCTKDLAIPEFGQDAMIKAAKEAGADIDVTRLDCGHSPFLSRPDETVAWIKKVAGEKV
jgi:pimeloyl-ACP methyl ester carboxylesterase